MSEQEHPEHLEVTDDTDLRATFLHLVAEHQRAISGLITSLSARELFGRSQYNHVLAAMRRDLSEFEGSANRLSEWADLNIGQI